MTALSIKELIIRLMVWLEDDDYYWYEFEQKKDSVVITLHKMEMKK